MDADVALLFSGLAGVAVFLVGIVMGNAVLFRMQKALNQQADQEHRVSPWKVVGRGGGRFKTFLRYQELFGDSPLVRQDQLYARLIFCGAIVGFGSLLILKIRR